MTHTSQACTRLLVSSTDRANLEFEGAMVLAHSLRDNGTKKRLAVLVTLDSLASTTIEELKVGFKLDFGHCYLY